MISYGVSWGLSIAGMLWPSAWLNQCLCGVSGHIREPLAQCDLEQGIPTEEIFLAFSTHIQFLFSIDRPLSYSLPFLLLLEQKVQFMSFICLLFESNSQVMSLEFGGMQNSEWPTHMFIAPINSRTCFMQEINELANDVLYMQAWWINLHFKMFYEFSLAVFFPNLETKSTSACSGNKQKCNIVWNDTSSEYF